MFIIHLEWIIWTQLYTTSPVLLSLSSSYLHTNEIWLCDRIFNFNAHVTYERTNNTTFLFQIKCWIQRYNATVLVSVHSGLLLRQTWSAMISSLWQLISAKFIANFNEYVHLPSESLSSFVLVTPLFSMPQMNTMSSKQMSHENGKRKKERKFKVPLPCNYHFTTATVVHLKWRGG